MKTLLLCLLAASLGAGDMPTGYFVKCDTIYPGGQMPIRESSHGLPVTITTGYTAVTDTVITCDTTWVYPVVVDTIVKCTTVVDTLLWIELWSEGDKLDTIGVDTVYDDYQKCDTVYRRRP